MEASNTYVYMLVYTQIIRLIRTYICTQNVSTGHGSIWHSGKRSRFVIVYYDNPAMYYYTTRTTQCVHYKTCYFIHLEPRRKERVFPCLHVCMACLQILTFEDMSTWRQYIHKDLLYISAWYVLKYIPASSASVSVVVRTVVKTVVKTFFTYLHDTS